MAKPRPAHDPRIELLPGQLRPVAMLAGVDGVELLVEHFGGQRLYVPRVVPSAAVAHKCGEAVARALHECYGGDYIVVPLARVLATARKHAAIRADGRAAGEIAREWKMSVNSVHRIRGDRPAEDAKPAKPVAKSRRDDRVVDIEEMIDRAHRR